MSNLTPTTNSEENNISLIAQKIDNTYKEGMSIYTEALNQYNMESEELKSQIDAFYKAKSSDEQQLSSLEKEIDHEERFLYKLNEGFNLKIHAIDELKTQYSDLIDENEFKKIVKRKENELHLALDEIEEVEINLLQQELERINLLTQLSPKRQEIMQIKDKLKKLEREKEYFSLKKLHQLPQLALEKEHEITTEVLTNTETELTK